jgi:hypothetical protein
MVLLLLLIAFALLGFALANTRAAARAEASVSETAGKASQRFTRFNSAWQKRLGIGRAGDDFRAWAAGEGSAYLPDDLNQWLEGLTESEARAFSTSLADYCRGLGFELREVTGGDLVNTRPALFQVYVEALVIYSDAYRKARQAHQEANSVRPSERKLETDRERAAHARDAQPVDQAAEAVPLPAA